MLNKLSIGSWITLAHPAIAEIMARAGFDWPDTAPVFEKVAEEQYYEGLAEHEKVEVKLSGHSAK